MGSEIHINRVGERFSSHTQMHASPRGRMTSGATSALRERLIATMVEVVADGGDPRLGKSRARP